MAELDAERIDIAFIRRFLPAMIGLDAIAREMQCIERLGLAAVARFGDFLGLHAHANPIEIDAVELLGELLDRGITALAHVGNNGADDRRHILGRFALRSQKGVKAH